MAKKKKRKKKFFLFYMPLACVFYGYVHFLFISLNPPLPEPDAPPLLYSNQCQNDLRLTALRAIQNAEKSIHLVMFGLREPSILRNLARKSTNECVKTDIYYDPTASLQLTKKLQRFHPHPIHSSGLMHQKILVIDDETVLLGSANMTRSSLTMHDNLMVGLYSPKIAKFLKEKTPHSSGHIKTMVGGQDVEVWLLPDPRGHALGAIKNLIRKAHSSIKIAMFTFTHTLLIEELIDAMNRGVRVDVSLDYHAGIGSSYNAVKLLRDAGADVRLSTGIQLMHHKFLVVDDKILLVGSANWTKAAFSKNHDCFLIINNLNQDQKGFMTKLWENARALSR